MNQILQAMEWLSESNRHMAIETLARISDDDTDEGRVALRAMHWLETLDLADAWMLLANFVNERRAAV